MAVAYVTDGGSGFSTSATSPVNNGTATLAAGDEVAVVVLLMNASSTGQGWNGFSNYNGTGSANGSASQLSFIAHDGSLRTELWRLTLTSTGAADASWTFTQSTSGNGNIVYVGLTGTDSTTPFTYSSRTAGGDTSIETDSVTPGALDGYHVIAGAGAVYPVAPSNPSHTADASFGTALENRTAGAATASYRTLSLWGQTINSTSATTAYTITDSQASTNAHGWQIVAHPPAAPAGDVSRVFAVRWG